MAVGFSREKADIDQRAGQLAVNLRNVLTDIERFAGILSLATVQYLVEMGYTEAEANLLRAAYTDLFQLTRVYKGEIPVAQAKDFRTNAQHLMGVL